MSNSTTENKIGLPVGQPVEITFGMAEAGGRAVLACLKDPVLMAQGNMPGEMAARVFAAMIQALPHRV